MRTSDYSWLSDDGYNWLRHMFCFTFVRGLPPMEALRRMGGDLSPIYGLTCREAESQTRSPHVAHAMLALAAPLGDWTLLGIGL